MTSAHELSEYYITKMADYLQQYHVQFSGWQEAALGHSEATDRHLTACGRSILLEYSSRMGSGRNTLSGSQQRLSGDPLQREQLLSGFWPMMLTPMKEALVGRICG